MSSRPFTRYMILMTSAIAVLLSASIGAAILIDPYDIYHGTRWAGINEIKPRAYTHATLTKRANALRAAPGTVILGNSRMDIGFDPRSAGWPPDKRPVFNLAIPGQGISGDLANLKAVFGDTSPKLVVIGIEFLDFLFEKSSDSRPLSPPPNKWRRTTKRLNRFVETSLSLTADLDVLVTLRQQNNPHAETMTPLGFNPFRQYRAFVRDEGHAAIFDQKNVDYIRSFLQKPKRVSLSGGALSSGFRRLSDLIAWCRQRNAPIKLVIYPYHADMLEGFRATGLRDAFEDWKRHLVRLVADEKSSGNMPDIELWDFSGYHEFASEPVPAKGDTRTHMRWYWEAGHFKSALGDIMLHRMFADSGTPEFGNLLTRANVETVIADMRRDGRAFRARRPDVVANIEKIVYRLQEQRAKP